MSECYSSQKKPNVNFRKVLQECIEKANPHSCELTAHANKLLAKL
jgi:hypothetical protein